MNNVHVSLSTLPFFFQRDVHLVILWVVGANLQWTRLVDHCMVMCLDCNKRLVVKGRRPSDYLLYCVEGVGDTS